MDKGAIILPPQLFASTGYYALMMSSDYVAIDYDLRFDKRFKSVHRYDIADTRGLLQLTVPVSRRAGFFTDGGLKWSDIDVSAHGRWWEVHKTALESAYGRTPFFEYLFYKFEPLFDARSVGGGETICSLCSRADEIVRGVLGIRTKVISVEEALSMGAMDLRRREALEAAMPTVGPYYQVRADKLGFISGLSILDLIFNMGTEAPLSLKDCIKS